MAIGEEFMCLLIGKNLANWFHKKGMNNPILAVLLGLLGGRIIWAMWHFFSYQGWSQPSLYLSALMLGSLFTILAIFAGMLAKGFITGKDMSSMKVLPILLPIAVTAHMFFDIFLARLMIIP